MLVFRRKWKKAVSLGLFALAINQTLSVLFGLDLLPVGDILVFFSAIALGPWAGLTSSLIACSVEMVASSSIWIGVQAALVSFAVGYWAERYPRLPSYVAALGAWLVLLSLYAVAAGVTTLPNLGANALMLKMVGDCCLVLIAGSFLLPSESWGAIAERPRQVNPEYIAIHLIPLVATVLFGLSMMVLGQAVNLDAITIFQQASAANLLLATLTCFGLLPIATWRFLPLLRGDEVRSPLFAQPLETEEQSSNEQSPTNGSSALWIEEPLEEPEEKAVIVLNSRGQVSYANEFFRAMAEVETRQILGKKLEVVKMNREFKRALIEWFEQTSELGPGLTEFMVREDKGIRFYEINSTQAQGQAASTLPQSRDGAPTILSIREISEKRTIEEQLLQAQRLRSLGSAVSGIAHSFNNFLTAIAGNASMARLSEDRDVHKEALEEISRLSESAGQLVWKLLDFVEDKAELYKVVNIREAFDQRVEVLKSFAGEQHTLKYDSCEEELFVECDFPMIIQAVSHIVLNSREAYPDGQSGEVQISVGREDISREASHLHPGSRPGSFARIRVQDFGVGMTNAVKQRAFDPMYSTKGQSGSSGLGLSIAFAVVRSHNGFLSLESRPNGGTSISVYLPLAEKRLAVQEDNSSSGVFRLGESCPAERSSKRILVVEDEPSVRDLVAKMINSLGYQVESCPDGESAIEVCQKEDFDLVLVDMMMPRMSGLDLREELKKNNCTVHTVVMTGQVTPLESLADSEVLSKPFDMKTLGKYLEKRLAEIDLEKDKMKLEESLAAQENTSSDGQVIQ